MKKKSLYIIFAWIVCFSMFLGLFPVNIAYVKAAETEGETQPEDTSILLNDDCSSLAGSGWTLSRAPEGGAYITDYENTVGNPNNVGLKQVPEGQYLFYGDEAGSKATRYLYMEKKFPIGDGAWKFEFDARFINLMTPSDYHVDYGFSIEIFANNTEYKITFNEKNKILAMIDRGSGAYLEQVVAMPEDDEFHNWSINYDGRINVSIKLDGVTVATFSNIGVKRSGYDDCIKIYNAPLLLIDGWTEVYLDNIKMIKYLEDPNISVNDDCSSLAGNGWTLSRAPIQGAYITDYSNTNGNPGNIDLKSVPEGQYLLYGDNTSTGYVYMQKAAPIGGGAWTLEIDAKIVSLMAATQYNIDRGCIFEIWAANKIYRFSFADGNKIYAGIQGTQVLDVNMPEDGEFHKWQIAFDGVDKVFIGMDNKRIGHFVNVGFDKANIEDCIIVKSVPLDWKSGSIEVYLDNIKLEKNYIPDWAKYTPYISGCIVLPISDMKKVSVAVNVEDVSPAWFMDSNAVLSSKLYKNGVLVASSNSQLTGYTVTADMDPDNQTGWMEMTVELLYDNEIISSITRKLEINNSVDFLHLTEDINAEDGNIYMLTHLENMRSIDGESAFDSGWIAANYAYDGTSAGGTVIENIYTAKPIQIPGKLNGWFRVYVGYITGTEEFKISCGETEKALIIKSSSNNSGEVSSYGKKVMNEAYAFAGEFNGDNIIISPIKDKNARIAYIKLKAMLPEEIEIYSKPDEGVNGNKVIYNNDGYSDFFDGLYQDENELRSQAVDIYEGQDVEAIYWCLLTTFALNYNSQYAGFPFDGWEQYDKVLLDGDRRAIETIRSFAEKGINPLNVVAERAHELGLKTYVTLRMNAFYGPNIAYLNGSIYNDYIGYRTVDKNGLQTVRMSYAHPEVRQYILNILKESSSVAYVDGVNLDFCRYPYIFGYESVLTDAYKAEYGVDPKDESTEEGIRRWDQFKADIMTEFMRQIRQELADKIITVRIPETGYFGYGLDIEKWIEEGLIDVLIPSNIGHEEFFDITPFVSMVEGTEVKLYGGINTTLSGHDLTKEEEERIKRGENIKVGHTSMTLQQFRLRAYEMYRAGYDGIHMFNNWKGRNTLGEIGDKVKLEKWYNLAYPAEWVQDLITVNSPISEYLSCIRINGEVFESFVPSQDKYTVELPHGTQNVPLVTADAVDPDASINIINAADLSEATVIQVASSDGSLAKTYKIYFNIASKPESLFTINTPTFTNLDGSPVSKLKANEMVIVTTSIESKSLLDIPATMIVALYDKKNTMKDIAFISRTVKSKEKLDFSAGLTMPRNVNGYYLKVFVCDSITGQVPYSKVFCFPDK